MAIIIRTAGISDKGQVVTRRLSGTNETPSGDAVAHEDACGRTEDAAVERLIDGLNAFHRLYGLLSEEVSTL